MPTSASPKQWHNPQRATWFPGPPEGSRYMSSGRQQHELDCGTGCCGIASARLARIPWSRVWRGSLATQRSGTRSPKTESKRFFDAPFLKTQPFNGWWFQGYFFVKWKMSTKSRCVCVYIYIYCFVHNTILYNCKHWKPLGLGLWLL